jgi:hypothetical protein
LNRSDLPHVLNGDQIDWIENDSYRDGRWELDLSESAVIDCRIIYGGQVQAEMRLSDTEALPNARRMLVNLVDPQMSRLEALITRPERNMARDFEAGVAWLPQVLGFSPIHVSAMSGMTDEPDILVTGPDGEVLIVECTTGVPDDDKLTLLISRSARMRAALQESRGAAAPAIVIAMIITPLPSEELVGIRDKAEQNSILILCRSELKDAIARSKFGPDARAALQNWRRLESKQLMTGERSIGRY